MKNICVARTFSTGLLADLLEEAPSRRLFDAVVGDYQRQGRSHSRWKDQVKGALTSLGVAGWRRRAQYRDAWKAALS